MSQDHYGGAGMPKDHGGNGIKWFIGAVLVPILVACIGAGYFQVKDGCLPLLCSSDGGNQGDSGKPASIFLSATSGPGGSVINISGEGFGPGEEVVIRFHTEEMGRTRANDAGAFSNVAVTIPTSFSMFAPQAFNIVASGRTSIKSATAQYTISGSGGGNQVSQGDPGKPPSIFLSATSGPGGSVIKVSGEGFGPGEEVVIQFHTEEMGRTRTNDAGAFSNVAVTIPTSFSMFAPQAFNIVASGKASIKTATAQFTISG